MKILNYCSFIILLIMGGCGPRQSPGPSTSLELPVVRKVSVEGAKTVILDQDMRTISVVLPESYTTDKIKLDMDLVEGVFFAGSNSFYFRGLEPISININNSYSSSFFTYKVYVEEEGRISANLRSELTVQEDGSCRADILFTSGVGTIPERPVDNRKMSAKIRDFQTGDGEIESTGDDHFTFPNSFKLLSFEHIRFDIEHGNDKFQLPEKLKLKREPLKIGFDKFSTWWNTIPANLDIKIKGGCFLQDKKYRVKIENGPQETVVWTDASYEGTESLKFRIPSEVQAGNYYFTVYEDQEKVSGAIYTVSKNTDQNGFQQVWTDTNPEITHIALNAGNFEPVHAAAGKEIFVNPFPMFTGPYKGEPLHVDKLPNLKISGNGEVYTIKPKLKIDNTFGDNALVLYYPAYTLPDQIKAGQYQLKLEYAPGEETGSFCKYLVIR